ncbi:MAG: isoprenylcysteine carboxylmethyltransferase family protein [Armatimonadetes bacterium]|nr:isoprenylcysteine carboxylmethyltransferase family protein [Armatimonadota bacterium]
MTISIKKAAIGLTVTGLFIGVGAPAAFWFASALLDSALGLRPVLPMPVSLILAAAAILIGVFWVTWAYSYLVFVGRGLPLEVFGRALHPTSVLVTSGPYAYTRNPMVLGALFILLGIAFLRRSIAGMAMVPIIAAMVAAYLATFEEKALVRRFGADYEVYRRKVPMLIPRLSAYIHQPASTSDV